MSNIEKIKAEIERQLEYFKGKEDDAWDDCDKYTDEDAQWYQGHWKMCSRLLDFIDSLPEENNPEPYNPVYDEDYLNEKIAKATKSWEGVDVNKMLADCRGYEEKPSEDLEEAANEYAILDEEGMWKDGGKYNGFIAGAEWQKQRDAELIEIAYNDGITIGKTKQKEQMARAAVEGEVCGQVYDHINVRFADGVCKYLEPKNISHIPADVSKYKVGDKVKIIIVKEDL